MMFCLPGDNEALYRLITVAVLISAFPLVAFWYSLVFWLMYSYYREIRWLDPNTLKAIAMRCFVVVSSWGVACGVVALCETCGETIDKRNRVFLVGMTLLVTVIYAGVSAKLMLYTRRKGIVDIDPIPFYGPRSLQGKFMVVTGANNGIGFETTRQLAAQGATVLMLCRNPVRAKKAMDDIRELQAHLHVEDPIRYPTAGITRDQLIFVPLDLTDFHTIRQAAKAIGQHLELRSQSQSQTTKRQPSYVDALICNAGLMMATESTTKDGLETMMQSNHLGHFLLMKLMLGNGMLKTTGNDTDPSNEPSRVCILTSSTYEFAASTSGFDFADPYCSNGHREYTMFSQYSMTKVANLLTSRELARMYNCNTNDDQNALAVFAVHPGNVRTNVTSNMDWYYRWGNHAFAWIVMALQKTAEEGAYSTVYTMSAPLRQMSFWKKGSFIVNCREQVANDYIEGPDGRLDARRLWKWSEEQLSACENDKDAGEKKEQ